MCGAAEEPWPGQTVGARQIDEAAIASEQLIPAGAGQRDCHPSLAHRTAHDVRVDRVERGLIDRRERVGQQPLEIRRADPQRTVLGAKRERDLLGDLRLVKRGLVEGDVEGAHRTLVHVAR